MMMKSRVNKRDLGIELARLIGCLIVIGVHVSLGDHVNGVYNLSRGYINCLLADGVAIFWLICGCFLFRTGDYKKVLWRTVKTIAVPMVLFSVFCVLFYTGFYEGSKLLRLRFWPKEEYIRYLKDALALEPTIPETGHLWYCYAYMLVMLAFPALHAFVKWMDQDVTREKWFCVITFGLLALNDYCQNKTLSFSHHGLNAAVPAAIEILWGHIVYRHKDDLKVRERAGVFIWAMPLCFLALNFIRMCIIQRTGSTEILYWYSTIGLACGVSVVMLCMAVGHRIKAVSWLDWIIKALAGNTFLIYLFHIPVITVLYREEVHTLCLNTLSQYFSGFALAALYPLVFGSIAFMYSLLIGIILNTASKCMSVIISIIGKKLQLLR